MGWWFSGHAASPKGHCEKVKTNLCDVECYRYCGWCSLKRSQSRLTFWTFVDHFMITFGSNQLWKTLKGMVADFVKKKEKDLLNCKYKVTFQPDGCAEPTCTVTCFIHFVFGHHLDNIQLLKYMFVVFYLFVYLLILLVS